MLAIEVFVDRLPFRLPLGTSRRASNYIVEGPRVGLFGSRGTADKLPVPVRFAVCGLSPPLLATLSLALRCPPTVGLKTTFTVQLAPLAIVEPHVLPEKAKSPGFVPAIEKPAKVTVPLLTLVMVIG